jgi:hypothetical protein
MNPTPSSVVTLSPEGLARAYADDQRLERAAKAHQITAAVAGGLIVGAILIMTLHSLLGN